jgi:hypothetical protein
VIGLPAAAPRLLICLLRDDAFWQVVLLGYLTRDEMSAVWSACVLTEPFASSAAATLNEFVRCNVICNSNIVYYYGHNNLCTVMIYAIFNVRDLDVVSI